MKKYFLELCREFYFEYESMKRGATYHDFWVYFVLCMLYLILFIGAVVGLFFLLYFYFFVALIVLVCITFSFGLPFIFVAIGKHEKVKEEIDL